MKRLMTVNLAPEQKSAVQDICSDIGAECVDIQRKHYGMKVGSLCDTADISGCGDETGQTEDLSMDMLIFDGVSSKELDIFLERYKTDCPRSWRSSAAPSPVPWHFGATTPIS